MVEWVDAHCTRCRLRPASTTTVLPATRDRHSCCVLDANLRSVRHHPSKTLREEEICMVFRGYATPEGTARYAARLQSGVAPGHFREFQGLRISSIGLGTYLGEHDAATDADYREAIMRAVELGCNLIDTAINYRFQQSERAIGQVLAMLFEQGRLRRDEVVIATKGGFIPF